MAEVDAEEAKLVTLARGARSRVFAAEGAALRDETGRTYSAAPVELEALSLSALELAVAMAVTSGSRGVEAAVICGHPDQTDGSVKGLEALRELGGVGVPVLLVDSRGDELGRLST